VKLGGFVIHGDSAGTLGACLDSLRAVCDDVVAVDSGSTDGSARIARERGVRHEVFAWQGYGAARAKAASLLRHVDFLLFLDSDELLSPEGLARIQAWKASAEQRAPLYRLPIRDWAHLPGHSFVFRTEHHVRLLHRDRASWTSAMVVHESISRKDAQRLQAPIEHRFATSLEARAEKEDRYALLWAVRAFVEGRRAKRPAFQRPAHTLRNALLKGAAARGGWDGVRLAWTVARYHQRKYEYLRALQRGEHAHLVSALREGRIEELFRAH
jgi:glycosyltransferase involved in cell wall biosynthesis